MNSWDKLEKLCGKFYKKIMNAWLKPETKKNNSCNGGSVTNKTKKFIMAEIIT